MDQEARRTEEGICRICRVCSESRPLTDFRRNKTSKLGRANICKQCHNARSVKYRECHKAGISQANRKYYETHKEEFAEHNKKYRDEHKKETAEYNKKYCAEHKQEILSSGRKYRRTEKGSFLRARNQQRRRARKMETDGDGLTLEEFRWTIKKQGNHCNICNKRFCKSRPATIDHIIPLSKGGAHRSSNIQALCGSCNSSKNAKILKGYINSWFP